MQKAIQDKISIKMPLSLLNVILLLTGVGPVFSIQSETPLEKISFSFARNCFWVTGGNLCLLPTLSIWNPSCLNTDYSCVCSQRLCEYMWCQSFCVWKTRFLCCHPFPLALRILLPPFRYKLSVNHDGRCLMETFQL